jgi:hypothetical protein
MRAPRGRPSGCHPRVVLRAGARAGASTPGGAAHRDRTSCLRDSAQRGRRRHGSAGGRREGGRPAEGPGPRARGGSADPQALSGARGGRPAGACRLPATDPGKLHRRAAPPGRREQAAGRSGAGSRPAGDAGAARAPRGSRGGRHGRATGRKPSACAILAEARLAMADGGTVRGSKGAAPGPGAGHDAPGSASWPGARTEPDRGAAGRGGGELEARASSRPRHGTSRRLRREPVSRGRRQRGSAERGQRDPLGHGRHDHSASLNSPAP